MTFKSITATLIASSLMLSSATGAFAASHSTNMAHVHMGHVDTSWGDTPDEMGFLPTAVAEADIAIYHAGVLVTQLNDLDWMQMHAKHVLHTIDPNAIDGGPGLGYGVLAAAQGTAKHIEIAAKQDDASGNVKVHAEHVATSAQNTMARVKLAKKFIKQILRAKTADAAALPARKLQVVTLRLRAGYDANGDGQITWEKGEGGLDASTKHMGIMRNGEDAM